MDKAYYGVYCKNILAVKTNVENFRWMYGSGPLTDTEEAYEKCTVKLHITVMPERKLERIGLWDKRFQSYTWDDHNKTIHCRRTILGLPIGYSIRLEENRIHAQIGKNYYRLVKNRVMNLHGIYYLLSDLANIILLDRGYLTLYASAIADEASNGATVSFAPPNTGKTVTATMLCQRFGHTLVGEDLVITDGHRVYGCPRTNSYRKKKGHFDSAKTLSRGDKPAGLRTCDACKVTELVTLSLGKPEVSVSKDEMLRQIKILNGYLFHYYSAPIIKILGYFEKTYSLPWEEKAVTILSDMVERCHCCCIRAEKAVDFYQWIGAEAPVEGS